MISLTIKIHLETLVVDPAPIQYDVFLSYSHRDDKQANYIVKLLQKLHPKLRLFFDIQELKTGKDHRLFLVVHWRVLCQKQLKIYCFC